MWGAKRGVRIARVSPEPEDHFHHQLRPSDRRRCDHSCRNLHTYRRGLWCFGQVDLLFRGLLGENVGVIPIILYTIYLHNSGSFHVVSEASQSFTLAKKENLRGPMSSKSQLRGSVRGNCRKLLDTSGDVKLTCYKANTGVVQVFQDACFKNLWRLEIGW